MVLAAEVFKPEKLKSRPGRSVIGRGNTKRSGDPFSAKRESAAPPG